MKTNMGDWLTYRHRRQMCVVCSGELRTSGPSSLCQSHFDQLLHEDMAGLNYAEWAIKTRIVILVKQLTVAVL